MKMVRHARCATALAALLATLAACEGGGGTHVEERVPSQMVAVTPVSQSTVVDNVVPEAPAVRVTDQHGEPMSGVLVIFSVFGGGTIASTSATTDGTGTASVGTWTVAAGDNAVTATSAGLQTVNFLATGLPRVPTTITPLSDTAQMAIAGVRVVQPPAVRVTDQTGRVMQGVFVTFTVSAGGGTLGAVGAHTDALGVASAGSWTLGAAGPNTVTATAGNAPALRFNATALPRVPNSITSVSAVSQTAVAGTAVPEAPAVRVDDQTGSPLAGVTVAFAVIAGGGQIASASAVTNAAGIASAGTWTLGAAGQNTVTATVGEGTLAFNATAQARVPTSIAPVTHTEQAGIPGEPVAHPPTVRIWDQTGALLPGAIVTFTVTAGGGSVANATATTDASGVASVGSWTLGNAPGENRLTAGGATGPTLTFKATGQDPCTLTSGYTAGSTVNGAWTAADCLASNGARRDWYSVPLAAQPVAIALTSSVDTYLALYDANNRVVATSNNDNGTNAGMRLFAPAGTYRLDVTTWTTVDNLGSYQLTSGAFTPNTVGCNEFTLVPNLTLSGTLTPTDCQYLGRTDYYVVMLQPGQTLTARMESTELDAFLHLFNSVGARVAQNDNGAGGTDALLTYTNATSNVERVRLLADTWRTDADGPYTLTVTKQ